MSNEAINSISLELAAKFKADTRIEDYGLSASPFFLRVANDGKTYTLIVASIENSKETKTSSLKEVYELDAISGELKNHMPAHRYYTTMSREIESNIPTMRTGLDRALAKEYGAKRSQKLDEVLTHLKEYGTVKKDDYAEYLKYALYSFSDKLADTLIFLSRTCEIETEHVLICTNCKTQLKLNTASLKDGDKIFVTCTRCSHKNVAMYNKQSKLVTYGKIYESIRNKENNTEPKDAPAVEISNKQILDTDATLTVSTNATLDAQATPQIKEITAEVITEEQVKAEDEALAVEMPVIEEFDDIQVEEVKEEDPIVDEIPTVEQAVVCVESIEMVEHVSTDKNMNADEDDSDDNDETDSGIEEMYDARIIEALNRKKEAAASRNAENAKKETAEEVNGIVSLGHQRKAFRVIKDIIGRTDTPNHVFGLKGNVGNGMDLSLRSFCGMSPDYINNGTPEQVFNPCTVIDISEGFLDEWIKRRIFYMRKAKDQSIFLRGNAAQWELFLKNEPIIASYITTIIEFPSYNKNELISILETKLNGFGMEMCEISEETKAEIFGSGKEYNNALKITKLASRIYFRAAMNSGKVTESDIIKSL